jgi:D-3-phosphoglycerate dehydrogenase
LAELLKPFKVNIVVVDPYMEDNVEDYPLVPLKEALPIADIITIHTSGDECLLGDIEFSLLKKGVFLLNAARGGLISELSLIRALDDGRISGAWLDTFEDEPYSGTLIKYENVILTPHIGSYTFECRKQMETEAVENLINALKII